MHTKLTLRIDDALVREAKSHAARRGKSVSQMFSEFIASLGTKTPRHSLPPLTNSLAGIVKEHRLSENDYRKHLQEKHS